MKADDTLLADATEEVAGPVFQPGLVLAHHRPGWFERAAGRIFVPEDGAAVVLGRGTGRFGPGVLDDPHISRRHAELRRQGGRLFVRDLDSRNGTRVNGRRVEAAELFVGDVLRLGPAVMLVAAVDGPGLEVPHPTLLGRSAGLRRVLEAVERVAPTDSTVLVLGPTGAGKELVAREIHARSGRGGPLVTLNCAAVPDTVLHSELFGHARGAFTGAERARKGLVQQAAGGTLFLDEIGDATAEMQATLLRLIENREVRAVGSDRTRALDVRFVAATNRDLGAAVRAGTFRQDLQARLARYVIRIPPLSQRKEDVPLLAEHFASRHRGVPTHLSPALAVVLLRHDWPGNVRELDNLMHRIVLDHPGEEPLPVPAWWAEEMAPAVAPAEGAASPAGGPAPPPPVRRRHAGGPPPPEALEALLREHGGNVTAAAGVLGVGRNTLYRWIRAAGIDLEAMRG